MAENTEYSHFVTVHNIIKHGGENLSHPASQVCVYKWLLFIRSVSAYEAKTKTYLRFM